MRRVAFKYNAQSELGDVPLNENAKAGNREEGQSQLRIIVEDSVGENALFCESHRSYCTTLYLFNVHRIHT